RPLRAAAPREPSRHRGEVRGRCDPRRGARIPGSHSRKPAPGRFARVSASVAVSNPDSTHVEVARLDGGSVSLSGATLEAFAADFHGFVARPGEEGYDEARLIWNGMYKKRPGLVLRCLGPAGV